MFIHWRTTYPSGRAHTHGADDGVTGWKLHAVPSPAEHITVNSNRYFNPALCGMVPGTGLWGMDLFIEDKCSRCAKALLKLSQDVQTQAEESFKEISR